MEGQGLLVELGLLDRPDGLLDAEADELGGGDVAWPHMAQGLPSMSALSSGSGARPFQWRWKVSGTSGAGACAGIRCGRRFPEA